MTDLKLPEDLAAFLRADKQLEYDPATCEAGKITFLPLEHLSVEFFPMDGNGPDDPHAGESGSYLVKGVSLIKSCEHYDPIGLLLWLPLDKRYGLWDPEHGTLFVFGSDVQWTEIAGNLPRHINAEWGLEGSAPVANLSPWIWHPFNAEQLHRPLPDIAEWYEARWTRRGEYRNGVQLRFPEFINMRVERDGNRCELTSSFKKPEESADWSPTEKRSLLLDEWQQLQQCFEVGFWGQLSRSSERHRGETATHWSLEGFREGKYRKLFRTYEEDGCDGDAVHEMGKQLARLAKLPQFET